MHTRATFIAGSRSSVSGRAWMFSLKNDDNRHLSQQFVLLFFADVLRKNRSRPLTPAPPPSKRNGARGMQIRSMDTWRTGGKCNYKLKIEIAFQCVIAPPLVLTHDAIHLCRRFFLRTSNQCMQRKYSQSIAFWPNGIFFFSFANFIPWNRSSISFDWKLLFIRFFCPDSRLPRQFVCVCAPLIAGYHLMDHHFGVRCVLNGFKWCTRESNSVFAVAMHKNPQQNFPSFAMQSQRE